MLTIGYIKDINSRNITVRYTPYDCDNIIFNRVAKSPNIEHKIGDIVFFDENKELTEDNIIQFSNNNNIKYHIQYDCQHVLYVIGSRMYDTENFYSRLRSQQVSAILLENISSIVNDDYIEKTNRIH